LGRATFFPSAERLLQGLVTSGVSSSAFEAFCVLVQRELDNYYSRPSESIAGLTLAL
jgi:hypothetical protein